MIQPFFFNIFQICLGEGGLMYLNTLYWGRYDNFLSFINKIHPIFSDHLICGVECHFNKSSVIYNTNVDISIEIPRSSYQQPGSRWH